MPGKKSKIAKARANARRVGKIKYRTISDFDWSTLPRKEKSNHKAIGSVYHVQSSARATQIQRDMGTGERFVLEWGSKKTNHRGTITIHGTAEQARALMTHAYKTLRISEARPDKRIVQEFIRSYCREVTHPDNDVRMWQIVKDIEQLSPVPTQYERAQLFLRTLLIRTLRNIYESATGEVIT